MAAAHTERPPRDRVGSGETIWRTPHRVPHGAKSEHPIERTQAKSCERHIRSTNGTPQSICAKKKCKISGKEDRVTCRVETRSTLAPYGRPIAGGGGAAHLAPRTPPSRDFKGCNIPIYQKPVRKTDRNASYI